jgi:hypothetical protein
MHNAVKALFSAHHNFRLETGADVEGRAEGMKETRRSGPKKLQLYVRN